MKIMTPKYQKILESKTPTPPHLTLWATRPLQLTTIQLEQTSFTDISFQLSGMRHWADCRRRCYRTVNANRFRNKDQTSSSAMAETARGLIRFRLKSSVIRKIMHKIAF